MTENKRAIYLGAGMAIGAGLGVALDNVALWLPLGIAIGAGLAYTSSTASDDTDDGEYRPD